MARYGCPTPQRRTNGYDWRSGFVDAANSGCSRHDFRGFRLPENQKIHTRGFHRTQPGSDLIAILGCSSKHNGVVCLLSSFLFTTGSPGVQVDFIAAAWLLAGVLAIGFGGLAVLPPRLWYRLFYSTGKIWTYALAAGCLAYPLTAYGPLLWKPSAGLTLGVVRLLLQPFISNPIVEPTEHIIGSQSFQVAISSSCAGLEGVGLMLVFSILWLWFFRATCRFPQALLLIPAGIVIVWLLNAVRIALLILIGNAGAPHIALGGFHSQAGWIAFNGVAWGFQWRRDACRGWPSKTEPFGLMSIPQGNRTRPT